MTKRAIVNLGLLLLVAALGTLAYLQPGIESEEQREPLTGLAPEQVDRIEITRKEGERLLFTRGESGWEIAQPIEGAANEFRIEPLLGVAETESFARYQAEESELAEYGLAQPRAVLRLNDVELRFGDTEPIDHRRYVMIGNTVHLTEDRYYHRIQSPLPAFVSLRLLPPDSQPVKITLPEFSVERGGEGRWRIAPAEPEVSTDAINTFVDRWSGAQAIEVSRYEGEGSGPDRIRVTLTGSAEPMEFLRIESGPETVLARPDIGMSYHLSPEQGPRLLKRPAEEVRGEE